MAAFCSSYVHGVLLLTSPHSRTHLNFKGRSFSLTHFNSLSLNSNLSLGTLIVLPKLQIRRRNSHGVRVPTIFAAQFNIYKAIQTVVKVGKDGIEAGTNLVPAAVPRPIARLSVAVVATSLSLFVLRSFVSTVFFSLGVMGFVYFIYLALNKDKGSKLDNSPSSTSTDEAIEEARKIMDKYK